MGPTGATGAQGLTGATGAAGPTGAIGSATVDINSTTSANSTTSPKTQDVNCDAGLKAVGGGFSISDSSVFAQASFPLDSDTWRVIAAKATGNPSFSVTAYVLCV
jgi:hypothetical protein